MAAQTTENSRSALKPNSFEALARVPQPRKTRNWHCANAEEILDIGGFVCGNSNKALETPQCRA